MKANKAAYTDNIASQSECEEYASEKRHIGKPARYEDESDSSDNIKEEMEELLYVNLINEVEDAELDEMELDPRHANDIRDPFVELTDRSFQTIFRLSKELCLFVITLLEPLMRPRMKPTDLDIRVRVLIAIRFFASGSYQMDVGSNIFLNVSQSSVSRCIKEVVNGLNHPNIFNEFVKFPGNLRDLDTLRRM
ncbi:hypothetical protein MML48_10g00014658 [Holotrichia oblita]|uniref:Uncharacterized protein n=1 Tax=Holotrichia oblita TaxID=644536 RepID=A0ACB9SJF0_HOLOL|nr:hypothetical protein MML48_10g00014658 [Holotrichia oblita]